MPEISDLPQRLIDLESRLAFQEHTLQEMSDVVARQQAQIDRLARVVKETQERLRGITPPVADRADETPPPHY